MSNHIVRNSLGSIAELANHTPNAVTTAAPSRYANGSLIITSAKRVWIKTLGRIGSKPCGREWTA